MHAPDLTYAVRSLVRRPLFAVTAIVMLGLGAGANAAVFSIVRGVLIKPLPYQQPERLVAFWPDAFVSNEEIGYWRERTHGFESIAAVSPGWLMSLLADGYEPLKVTGGRTSDNFFRTLGVHAALGRTLEPGDSTPGREGVVVLGAGVFERHFGGNPAVLGRTITLDGRPHQIVGVMPRGFELFEPGTDLWAPLTFDARARHHRATFSQAFARLRPGVTVERASRELADLAPAMRADLGKPADWGRTLRVAPLQATVTAPVRPTLLILTVAVGLILLLAAVNVATLVLGRTIERAHELAVRTALGASRLRLVRQLVVEQGVLAACGALLGLLVARLALPVLVARIPPEVPRQSDVALDGVVFGAVFGASVLLAVLLALAPLAMAARPRLQLLLRQARSTDTPARRRALGGLVAVQIGLAVVLGIGAALMLRTLWNLQQVDPGFEAPRVLTFRLQTTSRHTTLESGLPYLEQVIERVRAVPGVTGVGAIQHLPMTGYNWTANVHPVERPPAPGATPPQAVWRFVGWDYFEAMGIPLRAGRAFDARDGAGAPPVAIVNETFARREFGGARDAIGRRLAIQSVRSGGSEVAEIVGVTGDVRYTSLEAAPGPEMYRPLAQTFMFPMSVVVRTAGEPGGVAAAVRRAALAVDPAIPVADLQPLTALIAATLGRPRLLALLLSVFAASGLILSLVGVYGVVAYWVRQREREFGIRLALGAGPGRITRGVLRQGALCAAAGVAAGLPAAFALARLMQTVVFGVSTRDPVTFIALPVLLVAVAGAACYLPARRAARVDPVVAMRTE